jgi:hypothetical protein
MSNGSMVSWGARPSVGVVVAGWEYQQPGICGLSVVPLGWGFAMAVDRGEVAVMDVGVRPVRCGYVIPAEFALTLSGDVLPRVMVTRGYPRKGWEWVSTREGFMAARVGWGEDATAEAEAEWQEVLEILEGS